MAAVPTAQLIEALGVGGAERLAVQIANARAAAGAPSCLYVLTDEGPLSPQVDPTVRVRYFGQRRRSVFNPFAFFNYLIPAFRDLRDAIVEDGVRVVQSHLPTANFVALGLEMRGIVRAIPTIHNTREFECGRGDNPPRLFLRRQAYRLMLRRCAAVVAVSDEVREAMRHQLGDAADQASRFEVVPNGVAIPESLSAEGRSRVRRRFGLPDDVPVILGAGRLCEQKNFSELVAAAALLRDRGHDFRLVIAGEGELEAELRGQIEGLDLGEVVVLPGRVDGLPEVMRMADIFALSSVWEGLPLVLLEAMAAGVAVVATPLPGLDPIVAGSGAGLIVDAPRADSLAAGLEKLLTDSQLRNDCGGAGHRLIESRFGFDGVMRALDRIHAEAAAGNGGGRC